MTLRCKNIVKIFLLLFLIDMFVFPVVLKQTIPYVTELTIVASIGVILFDCRGNKDLFNKIFVTVSPMLIYTLYAFAVGCVLMFLNNYDISLIFPLAEMILLMIIVVYVIFADGNINYIAFLGIFLSLVLGLYTIINMDTLMDSLNDRLSLSGNMSSNTTGLLMIFGVLSTYLIKSRFINKYVKLLVNVLCISVIILTASRQSLLLCALIYGIWLLRVFHDRKASGGKIKLSTLNFAVVACILVLGFFSTDMPEQLAETKMFYRIIGDNSATSVSDNARSLMYEIGMNTFFDSPFVGCGYNDLPSYTHSTYMEILGGTGLIGFLLFYIPLFQKIHKYILRLKSGGMNADRTAFDVLMVVIVLFVMMFFRAIHYYIISQIMLTIVFAGEYLVGNKNDT